MNCENHFCIYQTDGKCTVEKININSMGMCTECTYPRIDERLLDEAKKNLLKEYEELDNVLNG